MSTSIDEETSLNEEKRANVIHILYDLLKKIADVEFTQDIYQTILESALEAVPNAEYGSILIIEGNYLCYAASFGFQREYLDDVQFRLEDSFLYQKTKGRMDQAIVIDDFMKENVRILSKENSYLLERAGSLKVQSSILIPIRSNKRTLGSLHLDSSKMNAFKEEDIKILELFALELSGIMKLLENMEARNYLLRHDEMTGVFNRRYSGERIREIVAKQVPFVFVSMDINNLKLVNDTLGHEMGDEYIKYFVSGIRHVLEEDTIFGRYGGDEFVLVFPKGDAQDVLRRMHLSEERFALEGRFRRLINFDISFSYGIVDFPREAQTYDQMMQMADERMYCYKRLFKKKR